MDALIRSFAGLPPLRPFALPGIPPRRRPRAASPVLGRIGDLEVRLASEPAEVRAAQELRYQVFFEEMAARPSVLQRFSRRDSDRFDAHCDHLLVLDHSPAGGGRVVGTYRLMDEDGAAAAGGFYSAGEFDIAPMLLRHRGRRFLELGRSCVLKSHRGRRTAELLWQGIWAYARRRQADVLFGCASLPGTEPEVLAPSLSLLSRAAPAPAEWRVAALPEQRGASAGLVTAGEDERKVLAALPPLIKGYLRLGAFVGEDWVVDRRFGTTDVFVVLPVERISARYIDYYGAEAERFAA